MQDDLGTDFRAVTILHLVLGAAVAGPVYGLCAFFVRQGVDLYAVRYHKCRVKTKTEVSDDLVLVCLILILLEEIRRAGESDLVDVFLYFFRSHTKAVIGNGDGLILRANLYRDLSFETIRQCILTHHIQLAQLCDRITAVAD